MAGSRRRKLGLRASRIVRVGILLALVGPVSAPSAAGGRVDRPTRRIDVVVNLDPDASSTWYEFFRGGSTPLPSPTLVPAATLSTSIRDPRGRSRRIEIHWARRGGLEWVVAVTPPVVPATPSIFGKLPLGFGVPPGAWTVFRFDARGELIGPETVEVVVPAEPSPGFGSGDPNEIHPEQRLALRLRNGHDATTLFASSFSVERFESGDRQISPPKRRTRACLLDPRLRGDPIGGEGVLPFVDASGRLVPNARQRFLGHRIDPVSGLQDAKRSDARIPMRMMPPRATTEVTLELERAATEAIVELPPDAIRAPDGVGPSVWISVFDSLGRMDGLELRLVRSGPDLWSWFVVEDPSRRVASPRVSVSMDGEVSVLASLSNALGWVGAVPTEWTTGSTTEPGFEFAPGSPPPVALEISENLVGVFSNFGGPVWAGPPLGRGRLRFDAEGMLAAVEQDGDWLAPHETPVLIRYAREYGESDQRIAIDFGVGRSRLAEQAAVLRLEQDGHGPGTLTSLRVSRDFVFEGIASNGVVVPLSALAFAVPGERVCELACSNGRDDDRDGRIDFGEDAGCLSAFDASERSAILACDDGLDGDGDGLVDFPADPSCVEPEDEDESPPDSIPAD
ncbi:MAG: hypothetical protein IPK00_25130 [Deltaproteobacteria bacterium]|nr:hypothetical protein [Deltaproteobacteria bacterium]